MRLKKSKFNILVPYFGDKTIIFNTPSGAIGKFDKHTLLNFEQDTFEKNFSDKEIEILLSKGIIVPLQTAENCKIDDDRAFGICQSNSKHIRIWTTSACNARCYYCFEKGIETTKMNYSTADSLITFIDDMLTPHDDLWIEWFGGEPLLNYEIIDYITSYLDYIVQNKKCSFRSTIISNGSLVTEEIANKMKKKWHISSVQITLDGLNEDYNVAKNYFNPIKNNFLSVITNIKLLLENNIHVAIRMNYDNNNFESLVQLIDYLHVELYEYKNASYYIYPAWSSLNDSFHSTAVADMNLIKLFDKLVDYKMATLRSVARLNYRKRQCRACSKYSFTVYPNGSIGKCSEAFHQIIGDIWNGVTDETICQYWTKTKLDVKCNDCVYLPVCQGGCRSSIFTNMPQCFPNKQIFTEIIKWYVEKLDK